MAETARLVHDPARRGGVLILRGVDEDRLTKRVWMGTRAGTKSGEIIVCSDDEGLVSLRASDAREGLLRLRARARVPVDGTTPRSPCSSVGPSASHGSARSVR